MTGVAGSCDENHWNRLLAILQPIRLRLLSLIWLPGGGRVSLLRRDHCHSAARDNYSVPPTAGSREVIHGTLDAVRFEGFLHEFQVQGMNLVFVLRLFIRK